MRGSGALSPEERAQLLDLADENARMRPPLRLALREDARRYLAVSGTPYRGDPGPLTILRLAWSSSDYLGVALYRLRTALRSRGVPVLPWVLNRICIAFFNIEIADAVVIREGLYVPHGNVILVGISVIGRNATLYPWTGVGCRQGSFIGPTIGDEVSIGTHTTIAGEFKIGEGATIGSGSVVTTDVPAGCAFAGIPARPVDLSEAVLTG
jgi:serine O-acetyltransferase